MAKQKQTPKAAPKPKPAPPTAVKQPVSRALENSEKPAASSEKWYVIALVAIALLVNISTINYSYTLDDPFFTTSNHMVMQGTAGIPSFFTHAAYYGVFKNHDASYRPLLLTSFAIEKQLFDFDPKVSHIINLLIFALQIFVLYKLLRVLFAQYTFYIPFFIALLFALHPIHTEVVASVKSRDELMAFLFSMICLLQSIRYVDTRKNLHLILSGLFFFLALMSKETPITLLAIVPLTVYFFRNTNAKTIITTCIPYAVVAVVYMIMRASFIESDGEKVRILVTNNALMAAANYGEKLATALFIQLKYIILLVFPHPLSWDYSYNQIPIISFANIKALAALLVIGSLIVYAAMGFKKKDVFAYCILFYGISAALTSNIFIDIGATMAERFIYSASLGFCIAVVLLLARLFKTNMQQLSYANGQKMFAAVILIAVLYGGKTIARNPVWNSNLELYESGMETAPNSWRAQYLLGVEYTKKIQAETNPTAKKELYEKSIRQFNNSLQILPGNIDVYLMKGYANDFAGGHDDSALACYKLVLSLDSNHREATNNLGALYLRNGRLDEAIQTLSKLVARDTVHTDAITNLAAAYGNRGMLKESIHYYEMAVRVDPNQPVNVFSSMSNVYRLLGDMNKSEYYRQQAASAKK